MVLEGGFYFWSFYLMGFYGIVMVGLPIWASLCKGKKKPIFLLVGPFARGPLEGMDLIHLIIGYYFLYYILHMSVGINVAMLQLKKKP